MISRILLTVVFVLAMASTSTIFAQTVEHITMTPCTGPNCVQANTTATRTRRVNRNRPAAVAASSASSASSSAPPVYFTNDGYGPAIAKAIGQTNDDLKTIDKDMNDGFGNVIAAVRTASQRTNDNLQTIDKDMNDGFSRVTRRQDQEYDMEHDGFEMLHKDLGGIKKVETFNAIGTWADFGLDLFNRFWGGGGGGNRGHQGGCTGNCGGGTPPATTPRHARTCVDGFCQ